MFLLVLLLRLPGLHAVLTKSTDLCTGSRYMNVLNTLLFPPHVTSSSLLLHVICSTSPQYSLLDPLDHLHWSLFSEYQFTLCSLKITNRCFQHAAPHLRNKLPPTLRVPYQSGASSSPSSSPSSDSDPGPVVDISRGVFHSRFNPSPLSKSFPP